MLSIHPKPPPEASPIESVIICYYIYSLKAGLKNTVRNALSCRGHRLCSSEVSSSLSRFRKPSFRNIYILIYIYITANRAFFDGHWWVEFLEKTDRVAQTSASRTNKCAHEALLQSLLVRPAALLARCAQQLVPSLYPTHSLFLAIM